MSDAYRDSAYACPVCANAGLREYQDRLICDECGGMLLVAEDFAQSIRELDGSADMLTIANSKPAAEKCPRCSQPMQTCTLQLGSLRLSGGYLRCGSHGLWVPRNAMTAAYARAARRSSNHHYRGGTDQATSVANMPSAHSGMSSAMASIAGAFGGGAPASSALAISQWGVYRPMVHTLFVSAHKGKQLACPACKVPLAYQGDRWSCTQCRGVFVETEALVALVAEMVNAPWEMPAVTGAPGQRPCPVCNQPLIVETLEGATIDRCAAHGVFFDASELEQVLHHASTPEHGLGAWLKRLFKH